MALPFRVVLRPALHGPPVSRGSAYTGVQEEANKYKVVRCRSVIWGLDRVLVSVLLLVQVAGYVQVYADCFAGLLSRLVAVWHCTMAGENSRKR